MSTLMVPFLITLTISIDYAFTDTIISIDTVSSATVSGSTPPTDSCGKMMAHPNQLYHVGTNNIFQSAMKNNLNLLTSAFNPSLSNVVDFSVSKT